jgi:hypothetical protein
MRGSLLTLPASAALILVASCAGPGGGEPSVELGREIAGTWLGAFEVEGEQPLSGSFITTYHADGTATTSSARAWGAGDPARYGFSSTHHLQWEATGPREIRWRLLHFGHDVDGNLKFISRSSGSTAFDEAFDAGSGPFRVEVYAPHDLLDPLDPNNVEASPVFTAMGMSEVRRLLIDLAPN